MPGIDWSASGHWTPYIGYIGAALLVWMAVVVIHLWREGMK